MLRLSLVNFYVTCKRHQEDIYSDKLKIIHLSLKNFGIRN